MEIDYDDMCNGNGEWKNIQPIMRSSIFSQAQDVLALKQHLIEFSKKLQGLEKQNVDLQAQIKQQDDQQTERQRKFEEQLKAQKSAFSKKLEDFEEQFLEFQFSTKQQTEQINTKLSDLENGNKQFNEQIIRKTTILEETLNKFLQSQELFNTTMNQELKQRASAQDLNELINNYSTKQSLQQQLSNVQQEFNTQLGKQQSQLQKQELFTQQTLQQQLNNLQQILQQQSSQQLNRQETVQLINSNVEENMKNFATKQVVQQIGNKLNEKIQLINSSQKDQQQINNDQTQQIQEETKQQLFEFSNKIISLQADLNSKLLDLNKLNQFDKQLKNLELQVNNKLDSNYLSQLNRQVVTQDLLDEEIKNLLQTCQKQIKNEVESFVDNSLYRTVKSIIKAEIDIQNTKQQTEVEGQLQQLQERIMRKIVKEISPQEQLGKIDQQCDDIRQLIDMVANDVEFKINKQRDEVGVQIQGELSAVRNSLNSMGNALSTQNDVLTCRLREYDAILQSSHIQQQLPIARWTWRTKKLNSQQAIIWSAEETNTLQSNFIWEKGKSSILVVSAGCYKIEFAIFARKRPTVQVVVNNEPILSAMSGGVAPALYIAPKGPAAGCYYGQSHQDYLYLAQNTVIQIMIGSEFASCLSGYFVLQKQW